MKKPIISIYILTLLVLISIFGEYIYNVSAYELNKNQILSSPSFEHLFGTDRLGRDVLARIIEASSISLLIGFISATISSLIGLFIGVFSAYSKGIIDKTTVVIIDIFLTFPTFFLLLALASYMEANIIILIFVISITGWMGMARLIRSESFKISQMPFIKILKIAKVNNIKIILKYYLPLLAPIFLINFTFGVSGAILAESSLSFLGFGVATPNISLGTIISEGKEVLNIAWWISLFSGLFIFLITLSLVNISNYLQFVFNQKSLNKI
jgi:peptide/nickel transport system permease protein